MSRVLAVDPSLNASGIVVMDADGLLVHSETLRPKAPGAHRLVEIGNRVVALRDRYLPTEAVIENYAFNRRFNREAMGEVGGVYRMTFCALGLPWFHCGPGQVRKFAGVPQRGTDKKPMRAAAKKTYGWDWGSDDEVDAFFIAQLWRAVRGHHPVPLRGHQREVANAIRRDLSAG